MVIFGLQMAPLEEASNLLSLAFVGGIRSILHLTLSLISLNQDTILGCAPDDLLTVVTQEILKKTFRNPEKFRELMAEINGRIAADTMEFLK
jgi:hypothetical protein